MLDYSELDRSLVIAALITALTWILLNGIVYTCFLDQQHWQVLEGWERQAPLFASVILMTSLTLLYMPFVLVLKTGQKPSRPSGIIFAAVIVMVMTIVTNLQLALTPTLVLDDPVTNQRVFLIRWCSWTPMVGLMTFMSDVLDADRTNGGFQAPILHAVKQTIGTLGGALLALCPNVTVWCLVQVFAFSLFVSIFPRVQAKHKRYLAQSTGVFMDDMDQHHRRYYSYRLLKHCAWVWTLLVATYYIHSFLHYYLPSTHPLVHRSSEMVIDTIFDVVAKGVYLKVILAIHHEVFDSDARARAQLGELRRLMQLLWDSTTDMIMISVAGEETSSTFLSPSFQGFVAKDQTTTTTDSPAQPPPKSNTKAPGVLLKTKGKEEGETHSLHVMDARYIESSHFSSTAALDKLTINSIDPKSEEIRLATEMIQSCWGVLNKDSKDESVVLLKEFERPNGETIHCELKVSQKVPGSFVAIVCDITDRQKLVEAEKRAHAETMARQKDAQNANRFTRHEIKNGLLSGIELCGDLQRALDDLTNGDDFASNVSSVVGKVSQVDGLFHEILDTVLAEAMARDVIHQCYKPNPKATDLVTALRSSCSGIGIEPRLPLCTLPSEDIPKLLIDTQLLKFIHRNAVSNASKYGKKGGVVATNIHYQVEHKQLTLEIVNEPGPGHIKLLEMGEGASRKVFEAGTRLHKGMKEIPEEVNSLSSGDGAWIMQRCAETMEGVCSISFEIDRTVFRLKCPVSPVMENKDVHARTFSLPLNTFGVGIDDSWIQRKQLVRIFANAGVPESKTRVIGKTIEDLNSTYDLISQFLDEDPSAKGLILVDDNLDYVDEFEARIVRSGSKMMAHILDQMPTSKRDRILVLVRSANDSAADLELYSQRTHGFFPKTANRKEDVLDSIEKAWEGRFGTQQPARPARQQFQDSEQSSSFGLKECLLEVVSSVDKLLEGRSSQDIPWPTLWSALHSLKGDIMICDDPQLNMAAKSISDMRGPEMPHDFDQQWATIRTTVVEGIQAMGNVEL